MLAIQNTPVPYPPTEGSESQAMAGREWRVSMGLSDIQFIPAKSTSVLGNNIEGKFKPISDEDLPSTPQSAKGKERAVGDGKVEQKTPVRNTLTQSSPSSKSPSSAPGSSPSRNADSKQSQRLWAQPIPMIWPPALKVAKGLGNLGNTCFVNSVLQCLFHTTPFLHMLIQHKQCPASGFCMTCTLRNIGGKLFNNNQLYASPLLLVRSFPHFAKDLRRGRQEDAHEFLRYTIDALQKSCLFGKPPKLDPKIAETSWVHQIFGGKLRSRVTCKKCQYNSDTFDSYLDLSLELFHAKTVEQALASFVKAEVLGEEDKYKCERCKVPVEAVKQFTIHESPKILTIHLKRFTITGRKISRFIAYPEQLDLSPYVSKGQFGHTYSLYGIISHSGGGPHSGHYFAHVKSSTGKWYEMNDSVTSPVGNKPPLEEDSAYVLFYSRDSVSDLNKAIGLPLKMNGKDTVLGKKRPSSDNEEEGQTPPQKRWKANSPGSGEASGATFDSPAAGLKTGNDKPNDTPYYPASSLLAKKINAAKQMGSKSSPSIATSKVQAVGSSSTTPRLGTSLVDYKGDDDTEEGEVIPRAASSSTFIGPLMPSTAMQDADSNPSLSSPTFGSTRPSNSSYTPIKPIPTSRFYGTSGSSSHQKRKSSENGSDDHHDRSRSRFRPGYHPYGSLGNSNLHQKRLDHGDSDTQGPFPSKNFGSQRKGILKGMKPKKRSLM